MAVQSESAIDILDCTKEWINKVNCGGLFPLNDVTYLFFLSIVVELRWILSIHIANPPEANIAFKKGVIERTVQNGAVQFHWTIISQSIDSEN